MTAETEETKVSLTPEAIGELRALLDAATPGEWRVYHGKLREQFKGTITEIQAPKGNVVNWAGFDDVFLKHAEQDANLIVALHNAAPALLDLAQSAATLRADNKRFRAALARALNRNMALRELAAIGLELQEALDQGGGEAFVARRKKEVRVGTVAKCVTCSETCTPHPTTGQCLMCSGAALDHAVKAALARRNPHDA